MTPTPKDDVEKLMNALVPFAEKMLREQRGFFPYGGAMLPDGSVTMIGAHPGDDRPKSESVIAMLEDGFRKGAVQKKYKATGIVYDVTTVAPGATAKTDAIAVRLDHEAGYSVVVMVPYRVAPGGEILKGPVFATKGDGSIFAPQ
jgi:hypothetical protein